MPDEPLSTGAMRLESPVGPIVIGADHEAIIALNFAAPGESVPDAVANGPSRALLRAAARQLEDYFAGRRTCFNLPLKLAGTPFRRAVWAALRDVPFAATQTYGDIARRVASAPRAVGNACGANPIAIIVPCHRIVAAGGGLGGFSGGAGCATKSLLLDHEASFAKRRH